MKNVYSMLKSPLFLFVFFGITLFLGYSLITKYIETQNKTITVSYMQYEMQRELFTKTWSRPPTEKELQGQIDNLVMDEIFYREGVALGLDKSDQAIKRRIRQMVELMLEDFTTVTPNENQLRTYLNENPEKFKTDFKLSIEHLFFKNEEKLEAEQFLIELKSDNSLTKTHSGSLSMIPDRFIHETTRGISGSWEANSHKL